MLSVQELRRIRKDIETVSLPDVCNILSLTKTTDNEGGFTESWGTAYANVSCRLDTTRAAGMGIYGEDKLYSASLKPFSTWVLTVPVGTTITKAHRVECYDMTFSVIESDAGRSWDATIRVTLEKL